MATGDSKKYTKLKILLLATLLLSALVPQTAVSDHVILGAWQRTWEQNNSLVSIRMVYSDDGSGSIERIQNGRVLVFTNIIWRLQDNQLCLFFPEAKNICGLVSWPSLKDQLMGDWFVVAMEPLTDSDGNLGLFGVSRSEGGRWLYTDGGDPGDQWDPENSLAFVRGKH